MQIEIAKLLIEKKENSSTVKVFSEQLCLKGKKDPVHIFGILEAGHPGQNLLFDFIVKQFKEIFLDIAAKNKKSDLGKVLEQVLQDVNQNLTEFIKEKNILIDAAKLNGVIAILYEDDLHFTYLGKVAAFLIHKLGKNNYKIIDILDNVSGSAVKPTVFKVFSNIISGQVQKEDGLFFGTANILDFVSYDYIKRMSVDYSATGGVAEMISILSKKDRMNFGGVLVDLDSAKVSDVAKDIPNNNENDVEEKKEKRTSDEKPKIKTLRDIEQSAHYGQSQSIEEDEEDIEEDEDEGDEEKLDDDLELEEDDGFEMKNEAEIEDDEEEDDENEESLDELYEDEDEIDPTEQKRLDKQAEKERKRMNSGRSRFFSLKLLVQISLVVILAGAIYFVQNLKKEKQEILVVQQEQDYSENIKVIEDKLTEISAKLIIEENDAASVLITEVESLIVLLPSGKQDKFNAQLEMFLNQIRNITKIDNPDVLVELANSASYLFKQNNLIYLYNDSNSLYKFDLNLGKIKTIATDVADKGDWQKNAPDFENGKMLLFYNGSGLSQYDFSDNELQSIDISLANDAQIDDLNVYGKRLYLLDGANNKIYKHNKVTDTSFSSGSNWLDDDTDLSGAVSLAIDGNIWVLKQDGEVIRFFRGKRSDFELETIAPLLNNTTKIYTTLELKNLYILDPVGKRLIVFDKSGNLLRQFTADQFDNLLDFVLATDKNGRETGIVYLLNGMKIFEIDISDIL